MSAVREAAPASPATIRTKIPARLDRLPWARFHWLIVFGLGTVWILDGLEVTNVGAVGSRLTETGSGLALSASGIGTAAAIYVIGACLGALFFGQLTDRFGRRKLFMITLGIYIVATVATAFSFAPWYFYVCRFVTGAGIGGEYASINSAIDELIPARARGRVDLTINGSYWLGSLAGSAAALFFLDQSIFAKDFGWRLSFGVGAVIGLTVLLVRRNVPESPRWLFIHGREEEAERIVAEIESSVEHETGEDLPDPERAITVHQRKSISFREIAGVAFKRYPRRSILAMALFVGQAFLYNGVTFDLGTLFTKFENVASGTVPIFTIVFAAGNFAGPILLGRLFDTLGRKPMISGTYIGSAVVAAAMAYLFSNGTLGTWGLEGMIVATFFLASAGASAAYLTASEIFPMETRALAIAFFYAIGTGLGGIIGPLLFGRMIASGSRTEVAIAFWIGAAVMAIGGIVELVMGVKAERQSLEDIATPITAAEADAEGGGSAEAGAAGAGVSADLLDPQRRESLVFRQRAEEAWAWAAEHRARAHEVRSGALPGNGQAEDRAGIEETLAEIAELQAKAFDARADAQEERAGAEAAEGPHDRDAARERAEAAEQRAVAEEEHAAALGAEDKAAAERHEALMAAATERARAHEHRNEAHQARAKVDESDEAGAEVAGARAEMHDAWALMHERQGAAHAARAAEDQTEVHALRREVEHAEQAALAAEERVGAAEHRARARELQGIQNQAEEAAQEREQAAERDRRRREVEERIRSRLARRQARDQHGLRRFRPGPGSTFYSPGMPATPPPRGVSEEELDHEIETISRALDEHGATEREDLARLVGARYWGPGRFGPALREAVSEGRARRLSLRTYGPPRDDGESDGDQPSGS